MFMITLVLIPVSIFAQIITPTIVFFLPPTQEFEIDLEGSQTLRLLCYEKCYNKTKQNKEDGESTDRIMGKGQIPVRHDVIPPPPPPPRLITDRQLCHHRCRKA